jgi:hypothetical protein
MTGKEEKLEGGRGRGEERERGREAGDNHTDWIVYYYCFHLQLDVLDHLLR